ncbi:MAG: DUF2851 family protein [Sphingobacteriales bacterium]|nr:MAG: DUF2851 family protein [Sphingobacteriales bacterium]
MQEKLLQFIWQHSLYNPGALTTATGEPVTITYPGRLNTNAGPDFLEAKIRVGNTVLVGHIELHINNSDWNKHGHQHDAAYQNVILHVVYNKDNADELPSIPVIELSSHIPASVIEQYAALVNTTFQLPCAGRLDSIRDITKESWLNRMLAERWEEKLTSWKEQLDKSAGDWRNLLYWRLAANFGFKINADPFMATAQSLPVNILAKHHGNLMQIEALLFGQAGMLEKDFEEEYPNALKKEYAYLQQKYKLEPIPGHLWKFLRMRPANFPTVRMAQFAALVHKSFHLFSQIIEQHTLKEILPLLEVTASEYWTTHFRFDEVQEVPSEKKLGRDSLHNIIINTIAPIQFLYATRQGESRLEEKALQLLEAVPAEKNNILAMWQEHGWKPASAGHSQALLQLFNNYCSKKRCLECAIGLSILKGRPKE